MILKPEKLGLLVCKNKSAHTDCEADIFIILMLVDGEFYEEPPWAFVVSLMADRVIGVTHGLCKKCKEKK